MVVENEDFEIIETLQLSFMQNLTYRARIEGERIKRSKSIPQYLIFLQE